MAELDIRADNIARITGIRVADTFGSNTIVDMIRKVGTSVYLEDSGSQDSLLIHNREHAENLIAGLQKALTLGFFGK